MWKKKKKKSNPCEKRIYPTNATDQTQQTHHRSTHPPPPSSNKLIKPPADQPIHHHLVVHVSWAQTYKVHVGGVSPQCGIEQIHEALAKTDDAY